MATIELEKLKGETRMPLKTLFKRVFYYIRPEIKWFIIAFLFILLNISVDVITPQLVQKITDNLNPESGIITHPLFRNTLIFVFAFLGMSIISQAFHYFEAIILQKTGQRIIYNLRMEVYEHIQNMSLNQFNDMPVGSLVTRVANYTANMSDLFTNVLVNLLRNILTAVFVFFAMFFKSAKLTGFMCIIVAIIFVVSLFFGKYVRKIFTKERALISDMNTFLNENLSGMKIIQLFNQEKRKDKEFFAKNEILRKTRYKVTIAFGLYRPFVNLLHYSALALTFYCGVKFGLSAGSILAFYLYESKFFNPIQNIADQLNNIQRAVSSSERLFNLLDVKPEVVDREDAIEIDHFEGKIEFKNVWFAYEKDNWILKDVSFVVEPKQTVAFVGATGAGKTTILSLIVRNYEIQKGQILIDGIDVTHIKITSLRKCIGQMLQDVFLFTGSIKTNITLHDDSFTNEEIISSCEYVNADSFINKLEKGLETQVIERGENFSQGQRQLLSFARTVIHKPQILILDEATANIDTETEKIIQESLEKIKNIGTMLVVAHRLSTIQNADKIIVLQKGEIIESGNHQELLKKRGYYYKLYQLQFENK